MDRLENLNNIIQYLMADNHISCQIPLSLEERQRLMRALMNVRQPLPANAELLKAQDWELQQQAADKGTVTIEGEGLKLWQGDITRLKVDAIVNAANAQMLGCWSPLHACIDNCIHSAAGIQLRQECYQLMQAQGHDEETGKAKITQGYNLPARYVIHTVGPIIPDGIPTPEQEEQLASCYRSCLDIAEQHQLRSIAFCCISTGVFHFPNQRAAEIAIRTVREHTCQSLKTIVFNVFLDKDYDIYRRLLQQA
ncbi:MAG: protein-ADP-ribose hydrolase [Bacteroidales bacterium]|nr:protein-ADP-ribose hydrolase [Bacteroidales bacterium]